MHTPTMTLALGCLERRLLAGPRPAGWLSGREGCSRERLSLLHSQLYLVWPVKTHLSTDLCGALVSHKCVCV